MMIQKFTELKVDTSGQKIVDISNKINNLAFGDILFVGLGHIEYLKNFNKKVYCEEISEKFFCYGKEKNENIYKYDENAKYLAKLFIENFDQYDDNNASLKKFGPILDNIYDEQIS